MPAGVKRELEVRSSTLVSGPSIITTPGTLDQMPRARADTGDTMPAATPADRSPLSRGDRVVGSSSHYSWKALQDTGSSPGQAAGSGFGKAIGEMGDHAPMAGAVQKNKAPF